MGIRMLRFSPFIHKCHPATPTTHSHATINFSLYAYLRHARQIHPTSHPTPT